MISLSDVELIRGTRHLLDGANLRVHSGQKVGLVGPNGSGKSSLFLLLNNQLQADRGEVSLPADWRIASVDQETSDISPTVLEHTIAGDSEYKRVEAARAAAETAGGEALARWYQAFENVDGYTVPARAAQLLAGLGFDEAAQQRPVGSFSGGWRMRVNLARALLQPSDLLLLDEPTNHLDLDAVVWLERWLQRYPGTLIVVSHDREFLDNTVSTIAHIDQGRIDIYSGSYSSFERQRGERLMQQQNLFEKQAHHRAHLQQFVDRFRAKASKARQAQSRIKALEKLQAVAPIYASHGYRFNFAEPAAMSSPLLGFDRVQAGYGDQVILKHIHLNLLPGSRIGLLGRNGAGKSTLVKLLAGILSPLAGEVQQGRNLVVGYFDQQQLEALDLEASPLLHLQRLSANATEQALRVFLGRFGFAGDSALAPVGPLSGGEKTRLALALLVWKKPNLLLLDEPTNHLDIDMREALVLALQTFTGAVVVVSHDRHLLRTVVDDLYLVANARVEPFAGDLDDYKRLQLSGFENTQAPPEDIASTSLADSASRKDRQSQKRREAKFRQQTASQRKQLQVLEKQIEEQQEQLDKISVRLEDPNLYQGAEQREISELTKQHGEGRAKLEALESAWLEISDALEERTLVFAQDTN